MFRFIQGLISISIQNSVLVLYDNDAEGVTSYERTRELNIPPNMCILKLPDLQAFRQFKTEGPNGAALADINGRAAAIECYLDFEESPSVRWTAYNAKLDAYQGELINKERFARSFLKQKGSLSGYDYSRIEAVLDMIVQSCASMKEKEQLALLVDFAARDAEE